MANLVDIMILFIFFIFLANRKASAGWAKIELPKDLGESAL